MSLDGSILYVGTGSLRPDPLGVYFFKVFCRLLPLIIKSRYNWWPLTDYLNGGRGIKNGLFLGKSW